MADKDKSGESSRGTRTTERANAHHRRCSSPSGANATAGPSATGPNVDFNSLPTSALISYLKHYDLAKAYPPAPPPPPYTSPSPTPSDGEDQDGVDGAAGNRRSSSKDGSEDRGDNETDEPAKTEEELLAEASGKRRAALASAAATSTSYNSKDNRFRARTPPATTTNTYERRKRNAHNAELDDAVELGEGEIAPCPTEFFDDEDAKAYLGGIAQRHFAAQPPPKEGELVVGFLYRCRTKGESMQSQRCPQQMKRD